jgi:hypothetical protein
MNYESMSTIDEFESDLYINMQNILTFYRKLLTQDKTKGIKLEEDIIKKLEKGENLLEKFKNLLKNNNSSIDKVINQLIILLVLSRSENIIVI